MSISSQMHLHALAIVKGQKRCFRSRIGVASEETEGNDLAMIALKILDPTTVEDMYNLIRFLEGKTLDNQIHIYRDPSEP